jgi:predicted metalloenzyme YecM
MRTVFIARLQICKSAFELREYIEVDGWTVPYLELPEPKKDSPYPEGLEHAELVVIGGLDRFAQRHADLPKYALSAAAQSAILASIWARTCYGECANFLCYCAGLLRAREHFRWFE